MITDLALYFSFALKNKSQNIDGRVATAFAVLRID
jgi:hypothetical protein